MKKTDIGAHRTGKSSQLRAKSSGASKRAINGGASGDQPLSTYGNARASRDVRRAIQLSTDSVRTLARRFGLSPTTIQKWRKRETVDDLKPGAKRGAHGAMPHMLERAIVMFRRQTLLPLDDCFYALHSQIPNLSRATLHRYFTRCGLGSLADVDGFRSAKALKGMPIGFFHMGVNEINLKQGHVFAFIAFDRISKVAFGKIKDCSTSVAAAEFLMELRAEYPFAHSIQINGDAKFIEIPHDDSAGDRSRAIPFAKTCEALGLELKIVGLSSWPPEWSPDAEPSAQFDFDDRRQVEQAMEEQFYFYNSSCKLQTLGGKSPFEYIRSASTEAFKR